MCGKVPKSRDTCQDWGYWLGLEESCSVGLKFCYSLKDYFYFKQFILICESWDDMRLFIQSFNTEPVDAFSETKSRMNYVRSC